MGTVPRLRCGRCELEYPTNVAPAVCKTCGWILECDVALPTTPGLAAEIRARPRGLWRWHELLPLADPTAVVSLGEGDTPLVPAMRLGELVGIPRLHLKNDTLQPTGSLKDRINTVACSHAREVGAPVVATSSTGNQAVSIAAYAAAAGIECVVFIPERTPAPKVVQALAHGARVVRVAGPYGNTVALFRKALRTWGWYSTLSNNPWRNEGMKTYAYEIWEALGHAPDWLIHPEASGGAVAGAWKGFMELRSLGWVERGPRMGLAQAAAAAAIVHAYERGLADADPETPGETVAESISVGRPSLAGRALRAVRESGGAALALGDDEILKARDLLARYAGIFAEPAAAASLAAAMRLRGTGAIAPADLVVCVVTGHGLKQLAAVDAGRPAPVVPDLKGVERLLEIS